MRNLNSLGTFVWLLAGTCLAAQPESATGPSGLSAPEPRSAAGSEPPVADNRHEPTPGKIVRYVDSLIRKHDSNGNGVLDEQEWRGVGGNPLEADLNQDGTITPEELIHRIVVYGRHRSLRLVRPGSADTAEPASASVNVAGEAGATSPTNLNPTTENSLFPGGPGQPDDADEAAAERAREQARRARKFFIPRNRLPAGIAGWFIDRDADGDGQITMREFSASWSPDVAAQFSAYDRNRDGVITAAESVSGGAKPTAVEPTTPGSTGGDTAPRAAN